MSGEALQHGTPSAGLDVERLREDFPALHQQVHGRPLVYLDNGATTQKPQAVIDALAGFYRHEDATVHRGVQRLSGRATAAYEAAREAVARFLNAADSREIVFVRGTTEAINLVAQSYARPRLQAGDEILITELEHHSNIVPWQMVCEQTGARLRVVPMDGRGELLQEAYLGLLGHRTRLVAIAHLSNALGTLNPVQDMIRAAHAQGVPVLVDGAQAVARMAVDVQALDCDFYAFSGHKLYGPTGIGALYAKAQHLEDMAPYQGGGEMILSVDFHKTVYAKPPFRFEAGTPHIAGAIGLGAAIDYVGGVGLDAIAAHEQALLHHVTEQALQVPGLRLIGTAPHKAGILSFVFDKVHAHDVGTIMDRHGIAIRAGHLCAMPVMRRFGIPATARASIGLYNTHGEMDALIAGMHKVLEVMGR